MRKWSIHLGEIIQNLYLPNNLDSKYMTSFTLFLLTTPKSLTANKLENSERDGNTRPPDLPFEKPVCRAGSNS